MRDRWQLLAAAGRCYLQAGDDSSALRCFRACGAFRDMAAICERKGRMSDAAVAYEQAGEWLEAARCYRAAGRHEAVARCLARAEDPILRAWTLSHELRRPLEAEALLEEAPTRDLGAVLAALLVRARCAAARADRAAATRRLNEALPSLGKVSSASDYACVIEWALAVSEVVRRPDLGALIIAAAPVGVEAEAMWDRWSKRVFGEAMPPPFPFEGAGRADAE